MMEENSGIPRWKPPIKNDAMLKAKPENALKKHKYVEFH